LSQSAVHLTSDSPQRPVCAQTDALIDGLRQGRAADVHQAALAVLECADPDRKLVLTAQLLAAVIQGEWRVDMQSSVSPGPELPGRPAKPLLVPPRQLKQRKLGSVPGRAALLHAVAHIEFNAINLALDAVQRFRGLPMAYYADWLSVAADEARHFAMIRDRLGELGYAYGDFPAHDGLWRTAQATADHPRSRMALVPRLLEARGLDVTPAMIERLRAVDDQRSADCLQIILDEEIRHVALGSYWFGYLCAQEDHDPTREFMRLLQSRAPGVLRLPFNEAARRLAGFSDAELRALTSLASAEANP